LPVNFVKNSNSLSPSIVKTTIGHSFNELISVDSTNIYAMNQLQANLAAHGAVYFAYEQTAGKGQRGREWKAQTGQNILLSAIIDASFLPIYQQFYLSAAIAVACYDFLQHYIPHELSIKWPNDIYWRDRKAGGILIENIISGNNWKWSVVGIGLNINQTDFDDLNHRAVSLKQITGKDHNPVLLAKELCSFLTIRYNQLKEGNGSELLKIYQNLLFKKGELVQLKRNNVIGSYTIQTVNSQGELVVKSSMEEAFTHGSIDWIL
jgi:BirA family biotin operon repressor/biotin-[acetyl-CoA-carboxylase] ligase